MDVEPIAIYFEIPATDSLGRMNVDGKLRSDEDRIYFHWKVRDRAFNKTGNEMQTIELEYDEIEEAEVQTHWFSPHRLIFRIRDPRKFAEVPGVNMGKAELRITKKCLDDARRFVKFADYKTSEIEADRRRSRLDNLIDDMAATGKE